MVKQGQALNKTTLNGDSAELSLEDVYLIYS